MQRNHSGRSQSLFATGSPTSPPTTVRRTTSHSSPRRSTSNTTTGLPQTMVTSMTIDEMRILHKKALSDAAAKQTELRLVLASRYRELVGSSDEVIKMKERSQELVTLVNNLPQLYKNVCHAPQTENKQQRQEAGGGGEESKQQPDNEGQLVLLEWRRTLSRLPRLIHRAMYHKDVYTATKHLIQLLDGIRSTSDDNCANYPLANRLVGRAGHSIFKKNDTTKLQLDAATKLQIRMLYLQMEHLPDKLSRMSKSILCRSASYSSQLEQEDVQTPRSMTPIVGAQQTASALVALYWLPLEDCDDDNDNTILNVYFESKATLLGGLLQQLSHTDTVDAEVVLSKMVLILQYDIVVIPYQVFVLNKVPCGGDHEEQWKSIVTSLPHFETSVIRAKCSKFLSTHLPLIRSKVKTVLGTIAGTTASALGQIRQSLYDKTDGAASQQYLSQHAVCTWDEAVSAVLDIRSILNSADAINANQDRFSLWGALFSSTFSNLVHSLLTTSFHSVHTSVVTTLRESLANAPPVASILPHEAYRNTLKIATDLDQSLLKVSADAHELLVHAEERVESERRLRQSLYVQTCEILGRLVCELRRMALSTEQTDGKRELIIGRLCFLLKFRLTSLKTLLAPESSPALMHSTGGMISYVDLQSAFELADDDEDGLVSFDEAVQAVESSFSGTPFDGASMVRDTLLLSADSKQSGTVSLNELTLLTARGLRHDKSGAQSALGTVQMALNYIADRCLRRWAHSSLSATASVLDERVSDFLFTASNFSDLDWQRLFMNNATGCKGVSPHIVGFLLDVSASLNQNTCPTDSLSPVPSMEYAKGLGIDTTAGSLPTLMDRLRSALLQESFAVFLSVFEKSLGIQGTSQFSESCCASALQQLYVDTSFADASFLQYSSVGLAVSPDEKERLQQVLRTVEVANKTPPFDLAKEKHQHVFETSDLFFSSLFGRAGSTSVSPAGEILGSSDGGDQVQFAPLPSSRRFALLPVQADRTLSDIQLRGKYAKEQEEATDTQQTTSGNVISGGFGFLSNMLKTGKN